MIKSKENEAILLLKEMLEIISETDKNGDPVLGEDHTGALMWILSLKERIIKIVE